MPLANKVITDYRFLKAKSNSVLMFSHHQYHRFCKIYRILSHICDIYQNVTNYRSQVFAAENLL